MNSGYELRIGPSLRNSAPRADSDATEFIEKAIEHITGRRDRRLIEAHPSPGGLPYAKVRAVVLRDERQNRFIYFASELDYRFGSSDDELIQKIDAKRSLCRFQAKIAVACPIRKTI